MVLRAFLYIVLALGVTGFAAVGWIAMNPPPPAPTVAALPPPPPSPPVPHLAMLVTARPLRAGALLVEDDLAGVQVGTITQGALADTPAARRGLVGGMVRQNLPAGAPLRDETVLRTTDRGFLAAVLQPGMVAVAIGVDPVSGAAGLIWPGDHVDLVLTQTLDADTQPPARRVSGETILTDLRVIAIDQTLTQGASGTQLAERNVRTVTLEVTSAQAERIAVAGRLGKVSLAVHAALPAAAPPASPEAASPAITWAGTVSGALSGGTAKGTSGIKLYSGPEKSEEIHF